MVKSIKTIELKSTELADFIPDLISQNQPVVIKGLVADWPLVDAGLASQETAIAYLNEYCTDKTVGVFYAEPETQGRFFYTPDMQGLNFASQRVPPETVLDEILANIGDPNSPTYYVGSSTIDASLPGLSEKNTLNLGLDALASVWFGNQSVVACHYDTPHNIACNAVGKRKFTVLPPEQIDNLYVGPLDLTPAGQAVSLVDFNKPDFQQFPRFKTALEHAQVAELEPGDAIFIPSLWWHHVEALDDFNVLINYWWRESPAYMGHPMDALNHALLSIRDLPAAEKTAWRALFDHYVFAEQGENHQHIPTEAQGRLGPMDALTARQLRALLINKLNR